MVKQKKRKVNNEKLAEEEERENKIKDRKLDKRMNLESKKSRNKIKIENKNK